MILTNKNKKIILAVIISVFLLIAIFCIIFAGRLLVVDEQPVKSDVIIVLAGDTGKRVERGAELYKAGYAPYMMMSGGKLYNSATWAWLMRDHAVELKVPYLSVMLEPDSETTYQNADYSRKLMIKHNFRSAVVVSSDYHMLRTRYVFNKVYADTGISLTFCAAKDDYFNPGRWWANNKSMLYTVNEYIKLTGYMLGLGY